MYRKFIATISAAAIAITALGATPVFADDRDSARAIAAILGLAVVGKIIHDNNKRKDQVRHGQPRQKKYQPPRHKAHNQPRRKVHNPPRYDNRQNGDLHARPLPRRVDRKLLPGQCLRSYSTRGGKARMFGRKCLKNNYRFAGSLPRHCLFVLETRRGDRRGYDARCLRNEGYRLARG